MASDASETNDIRAGLIAVGLAVLVAASIALGTDFNFHPDEALHVDAMHYFEEHWWPPALNADGLVYGPGGSSRVYTGELVYVVYGKLAALAGMSPLATYFATPQPLPAGSDGALANLPAVPGPPDSGASFQTYRILNVLLLLGTLLGLLLGGRRNRSLLIVAPILLCIPQVIYIYSYANSDAWGLSVCILLFLFLQGSTRRVDGIGYSVTLGVLVGLLFLSKETYWPSLAWVGILVVARYFEQRAEPVPPQPFRRLVVSVLVFLVTAMVVVTPLKIVFPLSQGDWQARTEEMREQRARPDFRPSDPTNPGYNLAAKGYPISAVIEDPSWLILSLASFYGYFGYLTVPLPSWMYLSAFVILVLNSGLTVGVACLRWRQLSLTAKALLVAAPFLVLVSLAASVYNSWSYDLQPQGRYLFAALIPLTILMAGTTQLEGRWTLLFRKLSWLAGYSLCVLALIQYAV